MSETRVLIVDDALVVRRLLSDVLGSSPGIAVAGTASNGRIALAKLAQLDPDLVILDIEMPEMDGLETLRELKERRPELPVIMFSTLTERGAVATLDALSLGAADYVTKPQDTSGLDEAMARIKVELVPKILGLSGGPGSSHPAPPRPVAAPPLVSRRAGTGVIKAVGIGVSTGGPNALAEIIPQLGRDLPVPVAIVQHMPPVFTRILAERLNSQSPLEVREAVDGADFEPGTIWLAPGGRHMVVREHQDGVYVATNQAPPENSCRPSVDTLFRSLVDVYGSGVLAVILTGMGHDGFAGSTLIHGAGGRIIAQDQQSAVVGSMPGAVEQAGIADAVVPLSEIAERITSMATQSRLSGIR